MLSNIQNDIDKFDKTYLLTLRMAAVVVFPLMVGLGLTATPLISLLLGEQWLPAAELLTIISVAFMLYPIHAINLNLLQVKGRSDIFLKLEIIKKALLVCILCITVPLGIKAMCIGMVIQTYIAFFINSFYTGQFSKLNTSKQLKALLPIWFGVFACAAITHGVYFIIAYNIGQNFYMQLLVNLSVMPLLYVFFIRVIQRDLYQVIIVTVFGRKTVIKKS